MIFSIVPEMAILSRIDILVANGRKWENAGITYHPAEQMAKGYRFDQFQIESTAGTVLFIPAKTILAMVELMQIVNGNQQDPPRNP